MELFEHYHSGVDDNAGDEDNTDGMSGNDDNSDGSDDGDEEESVLDYGTDSSIESNISSNSNSD